MSLYIMYLKPLLTCYVPALLSWHLPKRKMKNYKIIYFLNFYWIKQCVKQAMHEPKSNVKHAIPTIDNNWSSRCKKNTYKTIHKRIIYYSLNIWTKHNKIKQYNNQINTKKHTLHKPSNAETRNTWAK